MGKTRIVKELLRTTFQAHEDQDETIIRIVDALKASGLESCEIERTGQVIGGEPEYIIRWDGKDNTILEIG